MKTDSIEFTVTLLAALFVVPIWLWAAYETMPTIWKWIVAVWKWVRLPVPGKVGMLVGLRGEWGTLPFMAPMWQFTDLTPGPTEGMTFYVPAWSSPWAIEKRYLEKAAEFRNAWRKS